MNIKEKINYLAELCYGETGREIIRQFEQEELGYYDYNEKCSFSSAISRLCNTYYPIESSQYTVLKDTIQAIAKYYETEYPKERLDQNQNFTLDQRTHLSNKLTRAGKRMFQRAKLPKQINLEGNRYLFIADNGTIECAYGFNKVMANDWIIDHDEDLIGEPFQEALNYLIKEERLSKNELETIQTMIEPYRKQKQFETDIKTAILYQLMNNDPSYYGTRRAYFFALEYKGNLEIPIKYGLSTKDPNLLSLIQHYKKKTNQTTLRCFPNQIGRIPEKVKSYSLETIEKAMKGKQKQNKKRVNLN